MWRRILFETTGVIVGAAVLLLIAGSLAQLRRWHASGWRGVLYDQAAYVSTSRNMATTGQFTSGIIYTSTLKQNASNNYLYMPGHYCVMALSFALGGVGPVQSVVPSLIGYCLAAVCVYLTGRKLYGRAAGLIAAGLFALLPVNLAFAFTAMPELTFAAAASVALCVFVHLPPRLRVWGGPLLLALPFLFRETGSLLVLPMAGVILAGAGLAVQQTARQRWGDAVVFVLLSVGLLVYLYASPLCNGRPSLLKRTVFGLNEQDIYQDALAEDGLPDGAGAWIKAICGNTIRNVGRLRNVVISHPYGLEPFGLTAMLVGIGLSLAIGRRRRDAFALGSGLIGVIVVVLILTLYTSSDYDGLRSLMFAWPAVAIVLGAAIARWAAMPGRVRRAAMLAIIPAVACLALACWATRQLGAEDASDAKMRELVKSLGHNPKRLLAGPSWMGLPYVQGQPSAQWASIPANQASLMMLGARYYVGTLIVPRGTTSLSRRDILRAGFVLDQQITWKHQKIAVYKNKYVPKKPRRIVAPRPPTIAPEPGEDEPDAASESDVAIMAGESAETVARSAANSTRQGQK